ncbi:hypothetical protein ACIQU6_15385 [Streptomyces sp. NPDC090442]|uniref:hypothetical protein n=1 Tax=Streptomyces sp. NPDC090442 TaxID=3365962 RepID=UPI0038309E1C
MAMQQFDQFAHEHGQLRQAPTLVADFFRVHGGSVQHSSDALPTPEPMPVE